MRYLCNVSENFDSLFRLIGKLQLSLVSSRKGTTNLTIEAAIPNWNTRLKVTNIVYPFSLSDLAKRY